MPSTIQDTFSAPVALTITLGGLANSSAGVGRQTTIVDNTVTGLHYVDIIVFAKIKLGTSPTANSAVYIYLIRDDGAATPLRTDNAGATDAAITIKNAELVGTLITGSGPSSGDVLIDAWVVRRPGPKFALAVVNNTGVALDATSANQIVEYVGVNVQST